MNHSRNSSPHLEENSPSPNPAQPREPQLQKTEETHRLKVLTGREATPKEHVEEVLGGDVGLEAAVEVGVAVAVAGGAELLVPELVVLLPLLGAAQHGVRVPDGCGTQRATITHSAPSSHLQPCTGPQHLPFSSCKARGSAGPVSLQRALG